ncbi:MAG: endolytic transglycosylase MltG, partial [Minisyncoccia bacterium]
SQNPTSTLILASMLEKEAPFFEDQKIIAGILLKRLKLNMPLQVDATICYIKILKNKGSISCLPLNPLDFKINSPYNTYTNKGLPSAPISNPSVQAVLAALNPVESKYLYYLSDPKTKKTIFSQTLKEHNQNILKYLK